MIVQLVAKTRIQPIAIIIEITVDLLIKMNRNQIPQNTTRWTDWKECLTLYTITC